MMRVLSKEEVEKQKIALNTEMELWWASLTPEEREMIYKHNSKIIKQMNCSHPIWNELEYYGKKIKHCPECDLTKY